MGPSSAQDKTSTMCQAGARRAVNESGFGADVRRSAAGGLLISPVGLHPPNFRDGWNLAEAGEISKKGDKKIPAFGMAWYGILLVQLSVNRSVVFLVRSSRLETWMSFAA